MTKPLVIITGATSGIGYQTAKLFHQAGHSLLLIGRSTEALAAEDWNNTLVKAVDVANLEAFKSAVVEAEDHFGPTDAIINNAGMMLLGDIESQSHSEWQTMLDVNVMGVLNGMQAVLSGMKQRKQGTIINVSSIAGIKPFPNHAAYTATKFAVHGMSDNVREEVAGDNIRVLTIAPGAVETPLLSHTTSDQIKDDYHVWKTEMGGVLDPKVIAEIMLFAYQQPQSVCMREIVVSATKQQA